MKLDNSGDFWKINREPQSDELVSRNNFQSLHDPFNQFGNPFFTDTSVIKPNSQFSIPTADDFFKNFGFKHQFPMFQKDPFHGLGLDVNSVPTPVTQQVSSASTLRTTTATMKRIKPTKQYSSSTEDTKEHRVTSSRNNTQINPYSDKKETPKCVCGKAKKPNIKESKVEALKFRKQLHLFKKSQLKEEKV